MTWAVARRSGLGQRPARARGYDSRWDTTSLRFRRTYPLCGMRPNGLPPVMSKCADTGRITRARVVDHIDPHRGDYAKFNDPNNLQSLCTACHTAKTKAGL